MIEKEKIEGFINFNTNVPTRKGLLSFLWIMLIFCLPPSVFGAYAEITKLIMIPVIIFMCLWNVYLLINIDKKKNQLILFLGIVSIFISISLLIAAYKIARTEVNVPLGYIIFVITLYNIMNITSILNTFRLIQKGYYIERHKTKSYNGIVILFSTFGLVSGKLLAGNISQNTAVVILVLGLVFLSFLFSTGIHNLIKYYYIKVFEKTM